uniref:UBX domain-containing protein 1 n=1 Tax=Equus asinus TaxID=9793 RepID=A0A8C4PM86_EQUAS
MTGSDVMFCKDSFGRRARMAQFPEEAERVKEYAHFHRPDKHCQITFQLVALRDQPSPGAGLMLAMAFRITTRCSTAAGRPGLQNPRPRGSRQQGRTCTFLALGCTRPRPPPRDPNRFGHFRFPSAFFSAVAVVGPLPGPRGSGGGGAMAELTALESLIEMGFPRGRAEKALALTGNQGIEAAMDWMLELVAQKQREREEREEREALERERQRRRQGQELSAARQRLQEDEMRRAAEERRREKAEELAARQRVREKIERDKAERAKKYGGGVGSQPPATEPGPVPSSPSQEPPTKREYDQCRIQVRLPDGTSLTQTFRAREQLAAVRLYVELHRGEEPGGGQDPVQLLSGFPRRAFSEADMERPLQELGLVPSAVLIVAKKCPS